MNKAGSNSGHFTSDFKVQNFHFFYIVLVQNTIWEDYIVEKQIVLPYKIIYPSWNMTQFCDFCHFAKITTMKTQPYIELHLLEAKNAKKRTYIQLSHLDMIPIELLELINVGTRGRRVFGAVL